MQSEKLDTSCYDLRPVACAMRDHSLGGVRWAHHRVRRIRHPVLDPVISFRSLCLINTRVQRESNGYRECQ